MELNAKVENLLSSEQKSKFQKENGKFKLLENIVILPIITTLLGIYLENIIIVSISIFLIILFMMFKISSFTRRNIVYDRYIVPIALKEVYSDARSVNKNDSVIDEFKNSKIISECDKVKVHCAYEMKNEKYNITLSKINVQKINVEENDGVVDKHLEDKLTGIFAYVKLPVNTATKYRVLNKGLEYSGDKVKIPNIEFDENYDVFSQNPVEVRNILSAGVMARILEFNNKIGRKIDFCVDDNMLYIAMEYKTFLQFKGAKRQYVDNEEAQKNIEVIQVIDNFVRYIINMYEK